MDRNINILLQIGRWKHLEAYIQSVLLTVRLVIGAGRGSIETGSKYGDHSAQIGFWSRSVKVETIDLRQRDASIADETLYMDQLIFWITFP